MEQYLHDESVGIVIHDNRLFVVIGYNMSMKRKTDPEIRERIAMRQEEVDEEEENWTVVVEGC